MVDPMDEEEDDEEEEDEYLDDDEPSDDEGWGVGAGAHPDHPLNPLLRPFNDGPGGSFMFEDANGWVPGGLAALQDAAMDDFPGGLGMLPPLNFPTGMAARAGTARRLAGGLRPATAASAGVWDDVEAGPDGLTDPLLGRGECCGRPARAVREREGGQARAGYRHGWDRATALAVGSERTFPVQRLLATL